MERVSRVSDGRPTIKLGREALAKSVGLTDDDVRPTGTRVSSLLSLLPLPLSLDHRLVE